MLESETILGPYGKVDLTDDIDSVNDFPWPRGMPANWLVFATGMGDLTVSKCRRGNTLTSGIAHTKLQWGALSLCGAD